MDEDHIGSFVASELAVSPPPELAAEPPLANTATSNKTVPAPKSPPLAFERTPNDALVPLLASPSLYIDHLRPATLSPTTSTMGGLGSPPDHEALLQSVIHRQSIAIDKVHDAFAAERKAWRSERDGLYQRIAALEQLLKTRDHHSPAKSPVISPSIVSPPTKQPSSSRRLPSIAETENGVPLSHRRDGAPRSIHLPTIQSQSHPSSAEPTLGSSQSNTHPRAEDAPVSPRTVTRVLSPGRSKSTHAVHRIPIRSVRVPTPPPEQMTLAGVEDTPTRHNTHINAFLTRSHDDDDQSLKGPLNLPELPNKPDETNFTLDALSKRLEVVARSPDESQPTIFKAPTPGVASTTDDMPTSSRTQAPHHAEHRSLSDVGSTVKSPAARSPDAIPLSQQQSQEHTVQKSLEHGGIRLKKKPSINFGQPLGQLSGFASRRSP